MNYDLYFFFFRSREDEIIIAGQHVMEKIKKTWS